MGQGSVIMKEYDTELTVRDLLFIHDELRKLKITYYEKNSRFFY